MHYTIHILGAQHPTLMPNEMIKWFYHDGIKDSILNGKYVKGLLFENTPNFEIDLRTSSLKPYILIYQVT